jgi:Ala-tRNA(Pro) deacylase
LAATENPWIKHLVETSGMNSASMAVDRKRLFARLAELGIASTTVEHKPMFTVEQSQALCESLPGAHTKNLFLTDKDGCVVLVVAKDDTRVDLKLVASRLNSGRLSFGNAELLAKVLGVVPGSVTPFALINDSEVRVTVVADSELLAFAEVNCHPLENTATTRLATADLFRFIRACGHEPLVLPVS